MIFILQRCKKLYQAFSEIKKIVVLILKQEEIFNPDKGIIFAIIDNYNQTNELSNQNKNALIKSIKVLIKLSRLISQFLIDHKIFKMEFIY